MEIATVDQVFQFGGYTLDLGKGTLRHADGAAFLRPKTYALLTPLARHMGRVVPKSEIMDAVWPGVYVTEDSLTQSVREIRKVLGDDLVRTVSKRGYMLAAEVEPAPEIGSQPMVAVLRFRNESEADDPIVDGFAEDIINGLARFGTGHGAGPQFQLLLRLLRALGMAADPLAHRRRLSRRRFGAPAGRQDPGRRQSCRRGQCQPALGRSLPGRRQRLLRRPAGYRRGDRRAAGKAGQQCRPAAGVAQTGHQPCRL